MKILTSITLISITLFFSGCFGESRDTFYTDGQIKEKYVVKENDSGSFVKDGEYKYWYQNGQLNEKGEYDHGKKIDLWITWRDDGQKDEEIHYQNGNKHGIYKDWDSSGNIDTEGNYNNNKKHGIWKEFRSDGSLYEKGEYKNGNKVGLWNEWSSNGKKTYEATYNQNGKLDGQKTEWFSSGQKERDGKYSNGKEIGEHKIWYYSKTGSPTIARVYKYINGLIDTHTSYDPYGNILSSAKNGSGSVTFYNENTNFDAGKDTKGRSYTCWNCTVKKEKMITDGEIKSYPVWIYANGELREKKTNGSHSLLYRPD